MLQTTHDKIRNNIEKNVLPQEAAKLSGERTMTQVPSDPIKVAPFRDCSEAGKENRDQQGVPGLSCVAGRLQRCANPLTSAFQAAGTIQVHAETERDFRNGAIMTLRRQVMQDLILISRIDNGVSLDCARHCCDLVNELNRQEAPK